MSRRRMLVATCAVLVAAGGCGESESGVPGGAVAVVDGAAINQRLFDHWMNVAAKASNPNGAVPKPPHYAACVAEKRKTAPAEGAPKPTEAQLKQQCREEYDARRGQVLQMLVSSRWLEGEARDRGISVKADEVEKALDVQREQNFAKDADYRNFLKSSGQTEQDLLMRLRVELLSSRIRAQVTKGDDKVTAQQIRAYYDRNKERFAQAERRDLRIVVTRTEAEAMRAKAALAQGRSWKAVAKERSIDQMSKSRGGKLLGLTEGLQEKALDDAIFAARKGSITGPVKTRPGYYVFKVTKVMPASQQTLPQSDEAIEQLLLSERRQKQFDDFMKKFRDKWKDRTECRDGYATQDCKNGPKVNPAPALPSGVQPNAAQP